MLLGILDFFKKCRNSATDIAPVAQGVADTKSVRPTASDAQQVATGVVGLFHYRVARIVQNSYRKGIISDFSVYPRRVQTLSVWPRHREHDSAAWDWILQRCHMYDHNNGSAGNMARNLGRELAKRPFLPLVGIAKGYPCW